MSVKDAESTLWYNAYRSLSVLRVGAVLMLNSINVFFKCFFFFFFLLRLVIVEIRSLI